MLFAHLGRYKKVQVRLIVVRGHDWFSAIRGEATMDTLRAVHVVRSKLFELSLVTIP